MFLLKPLKANNTLYVSYNVNIKLKLRFSEINIVLIYIIHVT